MTEGLGADLSAQHAIAIAAVAVVVVVLLLRRTREIAAAREDLRLITSSAGDAIVSANDAGRITYFNPAAERMFGRRAPEVLGEPLTVLMPERFREAHERGFTRYLESAEAHVIGRTAELAGVRQDGSEFPLELSLAASGSGRKTRFIGILRDTTARHETVRALERARQAAEDANRLKTDFLATMSHEIRTPLNGVIGMTGLLLDTPLSPEQGEYVGIIRQAGETLLDVVNDILDFSKIEAGHLRIEPIPFDLLHATEEAISLFAGSAEERKLDLLLRWAPGTPRRVIGDAGRIRQILTNLVSNGVKFTERGHVLVDVRATDAPNGTRTFRFVVEDTGIGIPPEAQDRVFDRFSQGDTSTARRFGGTGLGLTISKQLCELMGGTIGFESRPNEGSRFAVELPLPVDPSEAELPEGPSDVLAGLRVLVVDDNAVNCRILEEQTRRWQMRPSVAASGLEALSLLRDAQAKGDPFRLALVDHHMPRMTGEELGRSIKTDPDLEGTVLVLLTSGGVRGEARRMKEIGFAGYLTKPILPSLLLDAVATVWASREQREAIFVTRHSLAERNAQARDRKEGVEGRRVLLAEDNIINQRVARMILEKLGCRVDLATNGREAVEMEAAGRYDIILMDCQMPELDGFEAAREIRRREAGATRIPIVAMTAHATAADREDCLAAGMDDHVAKPIRREGIAEVVERWTRSDRPKAAGPVAASIEPELLANLKTFEDEAGRDFVTDLVEGFLRRSAEHIRELRSSIVAGNTDRVRFLAHDLKGSSVTLGARDIARLSRDLEIGVGIHSRDEATALVDHLERLYQRLEEGLAPWRQGTPA